MKSAKKTDKAKVSDPNTFFQQECIWLEQQLQGQISRQQGRESAPEIINIPLPESEEITGPYAAFLIRQQLSPQEHAILFLALTPHLDPNFLDRVIQQNISASGDFPQLGGVRGKNFRGFLPTGETAVFLLAGDDLKKRFEVERLFSTEHWFYQKKILWLEQVPEGEPRLSARIILNPEYIELFTTGKISRPALGMDFPAQYINTELRWEDLVLPDSTRVQIEELHRWVKHHHTLMKDWGMAPKLKPGYRALFHGPPGTGKTLTASLLGKYTGRDVYRIDLSMIVSKYIGETEKNLGKLFAKAQDKDWILFFDEADALFGKRTGVRDAHDKYANQEVAYLLQQIEQYPGLTILASNFRSNIDEAFNRRFQSIVFFPMPKPAERRLLWQKAFPTQVELAPDLDLSRLADRYELSGSNIMNVVQYACLSAIDEGGNLISKEAIETGIRNEYDKEGKVF